MVMNERQIAAGISVGGQPTSADIASLHDRGYRTVVNVRTSADDGYLPEEERLVEDAGLNYAEIPVAPHLIDDIAVQRFSQALESVDAKPALVHCGSGGRAAMMVLLHLAIEHGWSLERALAEGEKLNAAPSETSPYRAFFEEYIKRHSAGER
jgi:cytochrome b6-f complex iron-sulfur subunit